MALPEKIHPIPKWLQEAIDKYKIKLDYSVLRQKLEKVAPKIYEKQQVLQPQLYNLQQKVGKILNKYGFALEWRFVYIAFAEEVYKCMKKYHPSVWKWPQDYHRKLQQICIKWKMRGCDPKIMAEIFDILGCPEGKQYL